MSTLGFRVARFFSVALAGAVFGIVLPVATPVQADETIAQQLRELKAKIIRLESALEKNQPASGKAPVDSSHEEDSETSSLEKKSPGDQGTSKRNMKGKMAMGMESMPGGEMAGRDMMKNGMGMMRGGMGMEMMGRGMRMMGRMKGMGQMTMPSSLPGFPGASHIYHIGATGFFLDHSQQITLTLDQKTNLNKIKEDALLKQATFDRRIEDAEQELWVLTSADEPDAQKIEMKIREIAKLEGDKRIAFIQAVGQAASVLSEEQRKRLTGTSIPDHKLQSTK